MCLITTQLEPLIADEDLTSYKMLRPDFSTFRPVNGSRFNYEPNNLYETEIKESTDWLFFSYEDSNWIRKHLDAESMSISNVRERMFSCKTLKAFGQGYHSCFDLRLLERAAYDKSIMVRCTIPKGSQYYKNPIGLVISNKLIVSSEIVGGHGHYENFLNRF